MLKKYGRVRQATDENILQRKHMACWIIKATNTYSEWLIVIALPRLQ